MSRKPLTAALVLLGALALPALADARPHRTAHEASWFLAGNPHVPLAVVRDGRVREAVAPAARGRSCGSPARWARVGSQWHELDTWGQIVATRRVSAKDAYDVTGCSELALAPKAVGDASRVLVSVDSRWRPSPPARWSPEPAVRASFEALAARLTPSAMAASEVPSQCASITEQFLYFEAPASSGAPARWAVAATNGGYLVASLGAQGWSPSRVQKQLGKPTFLTCHRPLAVFDMNGDGRPEIVLRFSEGTSWGDFVLTLDASGRWEEVATSPGGSTA